MSIGNTKLIGLVYNKNVVRLNPNSIRKVAVPKMCPNCLEPADSVKIFRKKKSYTQFEGLSNKKYTLTVQVGFAAHERCSGGMFNNDISGSAKVNLESKDWLVFRFREPLYTMVFITLNFNILYSDNRVKLTDLYDREAEKGWLNPETDSHRRFSKVCSRCHSTLWFADRNFPPEICPSCKYNLNEKYSPIFGIHDEEKSLENGQYDLAISCPTCGITMMADQGLAVCGRCGNGLELE